MSARFWLFSMASAGAALAGGLGLGFYAVTPPRAAVAAYDDGMAFSEEAQGMPLDSTGLNGPVEVRCTGCGPTLAQRQMQASYGSWSGYDDPVVQDYEARGSDEPEDLMAQVDDMPPSPVHQLPDRIERFAKGENAAPSPMRIAQGVAAAAPVQVQVQPVVAIP